MPTSSLLLRVAWRIDRFPVFPHPVRMVDHRTVLAAFASGRYHYMSATPVLANLLSRCPLPAGTRILAPPVCRIAGGRVPPAAFQAFATRFGVTLQPQYGSTEYGTITVDVGPEADVRPEAVGRPLR